ncbi:MAG: NAD+ synthase [Anaerolineaceae bacterium]|nr:NAD+ synthase [Anaerolineaceae bacterium]
MQRNRAAAAHILPRLSIHPGLACRVLQGFIRDALAKAGVSRCVVGLSGGIDSAVSAALAARALGPERVLAIRMPAAETSSASMEDAAAVSEALELPLLDVSIAEMAEPLLERFPELDRLRKGNVFARLRMLVLYDQSAACAGLVLGTSNKTEMLLGYSTVYGDGAAALQPIADLYKHQIRQMATHLEIPQSVLEKAPSADLWVGQTDEEELGFPYDVADALLYLLVDERYSVAEAIDCGFEPTFVEHFWQRVKQNHYKRTMPNIAKLSRRTIGHDFLYLRDNTGRPERLE